jgi:hypothetical protein
MLKYPFYPKKSITSMQPYPNYNVIFHRNRGNNSKICKTPQNTPEIKSTIAKRTKLEALHFLTSRIIANTMTFA